MKIIGLILGICLIIQLFIMCKGIKSPFKCIMEFLKKIKEKSEATVKEKPILYSTDDETFLKRTSSLTKVWYKNGTYKEYNIQGRLSGTGESAIIPTDLIDDASNVIKCVMGDTITAISNNPFMKSHWGSDGLIFECELERVALPTNLTSIGEYAFSTCRKLKDVIIPNSVTSINNYAFSGCRNLSSIVLPNSLNTIGNSVFDSCEFTTITIPDNLTKIGNGAFYSCRNLESVIYKEITYTSQESLETALTSNGVNVGNMVFDGTKLAY